MRTSATADLMIHVDPNAGDTLQHQIYAGVRGAILNGLIKPGQRLPSSRSLATNLGVSRTTSLLALDQLIAEGYVSTRPGSGSYVATDLPEDLLHTPKVREIRAARHPPLSARAAALADLPPRAWQIGRAHV